MFALVFVCWWLVAIEPQRCSSPAAERLAECVAAREARVRWERY